MLRLVLVCNSSGKQILSRAFANKNSLFTPSRQSLASTRNPGSDALLEEATGLPPTLCAQVIVIMNHMEECTGYALRVIKHGAVSWVISQERKINGCHMRCIILVSSEMPDLLSKNLSEALLDEFANIYRGRDARVATPSEVSTFAAATEMSIISAIQRSMYDTLKDPILDIRAVRTPSTGQAMIISPVAGMKRQATKSFRPSNNVDKGPGAQPLMALFGAANRLLRAAFPEAGFGPGIRARLTQLETQKTIVISSIQTIEGPLLLSATFALDAKGKAGSKDKDKRLKEAARDIMVMENSVDCAGQALASLSQVSLSARLW